MRNELNTDAFFIRFLFLRKCFSAAESHSKYLKRFRLSFLGWVSLRPQGKKLDSECEGVSVIQRKATVVWCLLCISGISVLFRNETWISELKMLLKLQRIIY